MALPYLVFGILYDTDGTTPVPNVRVRCRNNNTGDLLDPIDTTATGNFVFDAANFTNGYGNDHTFTVYTFYTNAEGTADYSAASNEHDKNITLSTVTDSSQLHYCTIQDIYDELDGISASDISTSLVIKRAKRTEAEIEQKAQRIFYTATSTDEIYGWNANIASYSPDAGVPFQNARSTNMFVSGRNQFQSVHRPIITITSLSLNYADIAGTDSWTALTQQTGTGGDYIITDKDLGVVQFINVNFPRTGPRAIKVTYSHGCATTPLYVEKLAILMTVKASVLAKFGRSQFDSTDDISIRGIMIRKRASDAVTYVKGTLQAEIDGLWNDVIGSFSSDVV